MARHQVAIGTEIRTSDGKSIGKVEHIIVDPDDHELEGFVADKGIFDRGRVVDIDYVTSVIEGEVRISLTEDEAKNLPGFETREFRRLDHPGGTETTESVMAGPGGTWTPYNYGAGAMPGAGAYTFFEQPRTGGEPVEMVGPLTASELTLDNGTDVVDAAGDKIGVVDEIVFGDDDKIEGFVVQQGFLFHHDVWVPLEWIDAITEEHVRLSVSKDQVEASRR
jgi:uncharacterized protein YrrD